MDTYQHKELQDEPYVRNRMLELTRATGRPGGMTRVALRSLNDEIVSAYANSFDDGMEPIDMSNIERVIEYLKDQDDDFSRSERHDMRLTFGRMANLGAKLFGDRYPKEKKPPVKKSEEAKAATHEEKMELETALIQLDNTIVNLYERSDVDEFQASMTGTLLRLFNLRQATTPYTDRVRQTFALETSNLWRSMARRLEGEPSRQKPGQDLPDFQDLALDRGIHAIWALYQMCKLPSTQSTPPLNIYLADHKFGTAQESDETKRIRLYMDVTYALNKAFGMPDEQ